MTVGSVKSPYAQMRSGAITVELATDYSSSDASVFQKNTVASIADLHLEAAELAVGSVSSLAVSVDDDLANAASQRVVQENIEKMELAFTTTSTIPGSTAVPVAKAYEQAVHLYFPKDFDAHDPDSAAQAQATFGTSPGSQLKIERDTSGEYA